MRKKFLSLAFVTGLLAALAVAGIGFALASSSEPEVEENVSLFGRTPGTGFGGCPTGKACFLTGSVSLVEQDDTTAIQGSVTFTRWPAGPNPTDQSITVIVAGMEIDQENGDEFATLNGFVISDFGTSPSLIDAGDADDAIVSVDEEGMTIVMVLDTDGSSGGPFTTTFQAGGGGNPNNLAVIEIDD